MSAGSPRRFPSARQHAELQKFFSDPRIAKYLTAQPWTVDEDHDVPDLAGYAVAPGTLYVDRRLAAQRPVVAGLAYDDWIKALVGTDYASNLIGHEPAEKAAMDVLGFTYEGAHEDIATPCEHITLRSTGADWDHYAKDIAPFVRRAELEAITKPPLDLDCRPYYQDPDHNDIRVLKRLAELGVKDAQHHGAKLSHAAAGYAPGHDGEFCRTCMHSDHSARPHCELVADPIEPGGWCRLWAPMK